MTTRRKLAIATWGPPTEGNIYGRLALDTEEVERYLAWLRRTSGEKLTLTAFVGACVARGLAATPSLNGRIWLGRYIPHQSVAISTLQRGKDEAYNKSKGVIRLLPTWILRPMLRWVGWLGGCGGFSIPALGVEPYPFGAAIITSIGMLGIDEGLVPPTPFAHVPLYVCVGAQRRVPAEHNGELVLRPQVVITATIDHRFVDGYQLATLAKMMRELFANPWVFSGLERAPEEASAEGEVAVPSEPSSTKSALAQ